MRAKRPDKELMRRRVLDVLRIRLDGAEFHDLIEYVREKEQEDGSAWRLADGDKPLTETALRRYQCLADKHIAESCRASRRKLMRRHQAQRRNLYARAVAQGDVKAALAVLRDLAELQDLYPSAEAKVAAEVEKLRAELAEAEARREQRNTHGSNNDSQGDRQGAAGAGARPVRPDAAGPPSH
jgi:hypothetical protein